MTQPRIYRRTRWRQRPFRRFLHRLRHRFGSVPGTIEVWHDADGVMWSGFRCAFCGYVSSVHECPRRFQSF